MLTKFISVGVKEMFDLISFSQTPELILFLVVFFVISNGRGQGRKKFYSHLVHHFEKFRLSFSNGVEKSALVKELLFKKSRREHRVGYGTMFAHEEL